MLTGVLVMDSPEFKRLRGWAAHFDVHAQENANGTWSFKVLSKSGWDTFEVPSAIGPLRLAMEICARTTRWICYRPGKSAMQAFLAHPDDKIERLVELYAKWKSVGFPEN